MKACVRICVRYEVLVTVNVRLAEGGEVTSHMEEAGSEVSTDTYRAFVKKTALSITGVLKSP